MSEHAAYVLFKALLMVIIPFVEPQLAGMLGAIAYLIVRHELKLASMAIKSIAIVIFFGWLGAWATVNIIAEHWSNLPTVWTQILSATIGFLSYDIMLTAGSNTKSIIGFLSDISKSTIKKGIEKWIS